MDAQKEIKKEYRERQEKYVYYVIALCVTAIGFSVFNTMGKPLRWSQIPLATSVCCWAISIVCGLKFLGYQIGALRINSIYFDIADGRDKDIGSSPQSISYASKLVEGKLDKLSNKTSKLMNMQLSLFYLGMLLFITWHIFEMYLTK